MGDHLTEIKETVIRGKIADIEGLVQTAIDDGADLDALLNEGLIGAMDVVGKMFSEGQIFVPEMLVSAETMKKGLNLVKPLLTEGAFQGAAVVLLATVKGDLHDIGKNIVGMMLEGAGFRVVDLGTNLTVDRLIQEVEEIKPAVVGLSALLTTTMSEMQNVIKVLQEKGLREEVKVIVGGAPVNAAFAQKIGADGYGKDATEAVNIVKKMTGEQ